MIVVVIVVDVDVDVVVMQQLRRYTISNDARRRFASAIRPQTGRTTRLFLVGAKTRKAKITRPPSRMSGIGSSRVRRRRKRKTSRQRSGEHDDGDIDKNDNEYSNTVDRGCIDTIQL